MDIHVYILRSGPFVRHEGDGEQWIAYDNPDEANRELYELQTIGQYPEAVLSEDVWAEEEWEQYVEMWAKRSARRPSWTYYWSW